jgi:proline iminopeptidase
MYNKNMAYTHKPFNTGFLDEENGHKVFFSQYGNVNGPAIVCLHGGPGSKSKPKHVKSYDLEKYHVITFDQRGCGKSEPAGKIENNTTEDLVSDMERLRTKMNIDKWYVAGGSWGSTLALAYAQTHTDKVNGLLLNSVFLARPRDVDWAFSDNGGVQRLFPDVWDERTKFLKQYNADSKNAAQTLLKILESGSEEDMKHVAAGVSNWESNLMNSQEDIRYVTADDIDDVDIAETKIFLHYEANNFFLEPDQLIENMSRIANIPTVIVHGRYDVLCPVEGMWEIKKRLNNVELVILPSSNHKLTAEGEIARSLAFNFYLEKQA